MYGFARGQPAWGRLFGLNRNSITLLHTSREQVRLNLRTKRLE